MYADPCAIILMTGVVVLCDVLTCVVFPCVNNPPRSVTCWPWPFQSKDVICPEAHWQHIFPPCKSQRLRMCSLHLCKNIFICIVINCIKD